MEQIDKIPYFNKVTAGMVLGKSGQNLDYWIKTRLKSGQIIALKKGLFISNLYLLTVSDKQKYQEYLAGILRYPSYISLEYALSLYGVIPEGVSKITSVTLKSSRDFVNKLGGFSYRNIKENLFIGFTNKFASKAKALFDLFYYKTNINLDDLRLNLDIFTDNDKEEFKKFVQIDNSPKMKKMLKLLKW